MVNRLWSFGMAILDNHKKVYLIRIGHTDAGFFAFVQYAINQIQYCEWNNFLPVVHYDETDNFFHDPNVGEDMWAYYFEPVAGYRYADIQAMLHDPASGLIPSDVTTLSDSEINELCQNHPQGIYHYTYGYWRNHSPADLDEWYAGMRRKGHHYVSRYVKVKPDILVEVQDFFLANFAGHHVIGAHIRGTDMRYAPVVALGDFVEEFDHQLRSRPDAKIFVATDQAQYLDELKARYGNRLLHLDCFRSDGAVNPMALERSSPARQGREVLLDALLLSRCDFMLKCPSAVGEFAHYFNPKLKSIDLNYGRTIVNGCDFGTAFLENWTTYDFGWDLLRKVSPYLWFEERLPEGLQRRIVNWRSARRRRKSDRQADNGDDAHFKLWRGFTTQLHKLGHYPAQLIGKATRFSLSRRRALDVVPVRTRILNKVEHEGKVFLTYGSKSEGMVVNPSTLVMLELCDGTRSMADVIDELCSAFPRARAKIPVHVQGTLGTLKDHGLIIYSAKPADSKPLAWPLSASEPPPKS